MNYTKIINAEKMSLACLHDTAIAHWHHASLQDQVIESCCQCSERPWQHVLMMFYYMALLWQRLMIPSFWTYNSPTSPKTVSVTMLQIICTTTFSIHCPISSARDLRNLSTTRNWTKCAIKLNSASDRGFLPKTLAISCIPCLSKRPTRRHVRRLRFKPVTKPSDQIECYRSRPLMDKSVREPETTKLYM